MNQETVLASAPLVRILRFEHGGQEPHRDPRQEVSCGLSLNFVERGSFGVAAGSREERFAPGMLFVATPGLSYRCRHDQEFPDDVCLSVQFTDPAVAEPLGPLRSEVVVRPTNRLAYGRLRLLSDETARRCPLALEGRAMELLSALVGAGGRQPARLFRPGQLAWYARRVDRAREMLEENYAEPMPLARLAREAAMSPFHFARIFRELVGIPPHRYLLGVRLRAARRLLDAGRSVTDACGEAGFSSLSHFIHQFGRAFGRSPSRQKRSQPERGDKSQESASR